MNLVRFQMIQTSTFGADPFILLVFEFQVINWIYEYDRPNRNSELSANKVYFIPYKVLIFIQRS